MFIAIIVSTSSLPAKDISFSAIHLKMKSREIHYHLTILS